MIVYNGRIEKGDHMSCPESILKQALSLSPNDEAQLIDELLDSLDAASKECDAVWAEEVEARIDAYERGEIRGVSLENVLRKYK